MGCAMRILHWVVVSGAAVFLITPRAQRLDIARAGLASLLCHGDRTGKQQRCRYNKPRSHSYDFDFLRSHRNIRTPAAPAAIDLRELGEYFETRVPYRRLVVVGPSRS